MPPTWTGWCCSVGPRLAPLKKLPAVPFGVLWCITPGRVSLHVVVTKQTLTSASNYWIRNEIFINFLKTLRKRQFSKMTQKNVSCFSVTFQAKALETLKRWFMFILRFCFLSQLTDQYLKTTWVQSSSALLGNIFNLWLLVSGGFSKGPGIRKEFGNRERNDDICFDFDLRSSDHWTTVTLARTEFLSGKISRKKPLQFKKAINWTLSFNKAWTDVVVKWFGKPLFVGSNRSLRWQKRRD